MGRTIPSYRMVLEGEMEELRKFARALRREDREALERMLALARKQSHAASYASLLDPLHALALSVLLEHEKELGRLRGMLAHRPVERREVPALVAQEQKE